MSHEAVAENSKNLGKKYASEGNFGRAFSHYLVALKLTPEWRTQLREEFSSVLCKWGTILDKKKRFNDLFTCYEQAVEVFPDEPVILNNLGAHLLRCGLLKEAAHHFRKCLTINPYFIRAAHNLENVSNLAVERWHFRMLNDQHRNEAFREAIIKKIRLGFDRVLDVGTGTGLLSLFSSEGKAKEVYACDSSPVMVEIAEQVFHSNNVLDVKLINKHSSELEIPGEICQKVSLVVTETFDAGLLGEDILETLSHAWEYLLLPPHPQPLVPHPEKFGLVIPLGASLYVTGIELDSFANDFHLRNSFLFENCNVVRNCDNYDTHDLSRASFRCLTGTERIFHIDFNDPKALAEISRRKVELTLKCEHSGRLDCFAVWFDLCLDEDIVLSTSPLSKSSSAWDQAIFPLPRSTTVKAGQDVTIAAYCENKKLNISVSDSFINEPKCEASEEVIKILNNGKLADVFCQVVNKLSPAFSNSVNILDCYSFPVFGLNFLIKRNDKFRDKLTSLVPTEKDQHLVCLMAEKYNLQVDVMVMRETCFEDCLQEKLFDIILLDFIDINGEINDGILQQLEYLKSLLKPGGIILPEQAVVIGQFIYSDWLDQTSKVSDDSVTCGYNIAEYINTYQVRHFIDLELKSVEKTVCSEPFELFSLLDSSDSIFENSVPRCSDAVQANAMVYWIRMKFTEDSDEVITNSASYRQAAILFSKIQLSEEIKFNIICNNGLFNIELLKS